MLYRILCDESCHLEKDGHPMMVLGAIRVKRSMARGLNQKIRDIKKRHGLPSGQEIKWNFVSQSKHQMYHEIIDLFFNEPSLSFRAVIAHKDGLDHRLFDQTHNEWFFKMYYLLLGKLLDPSELYEVFIDGVDSGAAYRAQDLKEYLNKSFGGSEVVQRIQVVDSKKSPLTQVTDLFVGAIAYANREMDTNGTKLELIQQIKDNTKLSLKSNSGYAYEKFNLFHWNLGQR